MSSQSRERDKISTFERTIKTRVITNASELGERLDLPRDVIEKADRASEAFPLLFPESLIPRVQRARIDDPILVQFLPDERELVKTPGFSEDPLCEWQEDKGSASAKDASNYPYILQKYAGRALILTTHSCAARCRFCFRRYFPKNRALFPIPTASRDVDDEKAISEYLRKALVPIQTDESIRELVFSGGDPLMLANRELRGLLNYIKTIAHVKRVRFHSRVPVLAPARIDDGFPAFDDFNECDSPTPLILHLSLHVNSPNEIDEAVARALSRLRSKGYVLTSQTTLLRGVNDRWETLLDLYEKLINLGVVPYYLFQLDRVQGAAHWETPTDLGRSIIRELSARLPGYAVPRFSREIPGRPMKVDLSVEKELD